MTRYEYKAIPPPTRGEKARGAKTPADRFAHAMTSLMNEMGAEGWEYIRADTLPAEERAGFTRKVTVYQNLLTFRRALPPAQEKSGPKAQATENSNPESFGPENSGPEHSGPPHPAAREPAGIPMVALKTREAAPSQAAPATAPRISVRDDQAAPRAPTVKLGAAARLPGAGEKPTSGK